MFSEECLIWVMVVVFLLPLVMFLYLAPLINSAEFPHSFYCHCSGLFKGLVFTEVLLSCEYPRQMPEAQLFDRFWKKDCTVITSVSPVLSSLNVSAVNVSIKKFNLSKPVREHQAVSRLWREEFE